MKYNLVFLFFSLLPIAASSQLDENFTLIDMEVEVKKALISGTLHTPDATAALPVVIFVPGSGKVKKEEIEGIGRAIFGGMRTAVFLYDKSGVGKPHTSYGSTGMQAINISQ